MQEDFPNTASNYILNTTVQLAIMTHIDSVGG